LQCGCWPQGFYGGQVLATGARRQLKKARTRLRLTRASTWSQHSRQGALIPHWAIRGKILARFVGTWDGEYNEFSKDGKATHSSGEWVFGWVMDGRAIQDLFIIHPSTAHREGFIGTTLRYFDPKSGTWSVTFIDPENGAVETLKGGAVGDDRIVLLSQNTDGKVSRWSFEDIRPDSWVFRDERSSDGGKTWRLLEVDHLKRRGEAPVAQ
jgi:hypothetical protein